MSLADITERIARRREPYSTHAKGDRWNSIGMQGRCHLGDRREDAPVPRQVWKSVADSCVRVVYCGGSAQDWNITDCVSYIVMHQNGLREPLAADHHFEQAGFVALLK